jgi:hypothetical protein
LSPHRSAGHSPLEQPWARQGIVDFLSMGRPYVSGVHTEIDVTDLLARIASCQRELRMGVSLHGVLIHYLAQVAMRHPEVLNYRRGKRLITFREVDLATAIRRNASNGARIPMRYIFRGAQARSLADIQWELRQAMKTPVAKPPRRRRPWSRLAARLLIWRMARDPLLFKRHLGNFFVTNLQVPGLTIPFNIYAPNPYTFGVAIGSIIDRVQPAPDGGMRVRKMLTLSGSADHAVVDGYPLAQFTVTLNAMIAACAGLDDDFIRAMRAGHNRGPA